MPSQPRSKTVDEIAQTKLRLLRKREEGLKFDSEKIRTDLLPPGPLLRMAEILTFGANKYGDHNWEKGISYNRCYGAALRHMFAWQRGEDLDPETNLSHLAHAATNLLFLLEFLETHPELDNRPNSQARRSLPSEPVPAEVPAVPLRGHRPDPDVQPL